jgi:hypothetical protein
LTIYFWIRVNRPTDNLIAPVATLIESVVVAFEKKSQFRRPLLFANRLTVSAIVAVAVWPWKKIRLIGNLKLDAEIMTGRAASAG